MIHSQRIAILTSFTLLAAAGPATEAQAAPAENQQNKLEFAAFFAPDNVVIDSNRSLMFCLVNRGGDGELVRGGADDDFLSLTIPLGPEASELEADGATIGCLAPSAWDCSLDVLSSSVVATVRPLGLSVAVAAGDTPCFELTALQVNGVQGMTFSALEQTIHARRAKELLTTTLPIFKSVRGTIQHDDLAEVSEDQHHEKTTSFSELEDEATDAQIPNDITVNFAAMAGDADTLNGVFAVELEESLEIDADIAAHAGQASAHHAKYTDADAVAANAAIFKALERRLECLENPQYLDRGDGTVYECESDLVWLKRANCSGSKKWDSAKSWAANLADGACGLSDGSSAGDWRLPTKAEWQGMFDDAAAAGCTNGPRVANTTGTGCWTEGDPFSGIGTLGYWTSERPRSSRAWEARVESATFRSVPTKWVSNDAWVVRAER